MWSTERESGSIRHWTSEATRCKINLKVNFHVLLNVSLMVGCILKWYHSSYALRCYSMYCPENDCRMHPAFLMQLNLYSNLIKFKMGLIEVLVNWSTLITISRYWTSTPGQLVIKSSRTQDTASKEKIKCLRLWYTKSNLWRHLWSYPVS